MRILSKIYLTKAPISLLKYSLRVTWAYWICWAFKVEVQTGPTYQCFFIFLANLAKHVSWWRCLWGVMEQLMRHELDEESILLDSRMANSCIKWSPDGGVLAVAGSTQRDTPSSMVQLYSSNGNHLRTLQIPGTRIRSVHSISVLSHQSHPHILF
jgi:WD40 repeat protein